MHTPAPALQGTWPELAPRPTFQQAHPASALTQTIARQSRLDQEQQAV
ncbi:hypothetical protein ACIQTZ_19250 [Paenarthrobacter sp. NPDC090520]